MFEKRVKAAKFAELRLVLLIEPKLIQTAPSPVRKINQLNDIL